MANLLQIGTILLFFLSIVIFFINGSLALLTLLLSGVFLVLYSITPQGRREAKQHSKEHQKIREQRERDQKIKKEQDRKEQAIKEEQGRKEKAIKEEQDRKEQAAIEEANEEIKRKLRRLSENPIDHEALEYVVNELEDLPEARLKPVIDEIAIPLLKIKPLDERVRNVVLACNQRVVFPRSTPDRLLAQTLYDTALDILQQHPEQVSLKRYALDVGRWHCAIARGGTKVTVYDEQSIQNDILVRSR